MKKSGAVAIITTIMLGLAAWAGTSIVDHETRLATEELHTSYLKKDIAEIKEGIKVLVKRGEH